MVSVSSILTDPRELARFLSEANVGYIGSKYLALSSFVLLVYDHLIYLDQEVGRVDAYSKLFL